MPAGAGGGGEMVVISPHLDLDSPPALLIAGGLFFLANNDPRGWVLILLGTVVVLEAYRRSYQNG